jgi:hypothetical protein
MRIDAHRSRIVNKTIFSLAQQVIKTLSFALCLSLAVEETIGDFTEWISGEPAGGWRVVPAITETDEAGARLVKLRLQPQWPA